MTAAVPIWLSREAAQRIWRSTYGVHGGAGGAYPIGMAIVREATRIGETRRAMGRVRSPRSQASR